MQKQNSFRPAALLLFTLIPTVACAQKIYWTDNNLDVIRRSDGDGSNVEDIIMGPRFSFRGIALDLVEGRIYYTLNDQALIRRANLDGSSLEDVLTSPINGLGSIALDLAARRMYWIADLWIFRANFDGTGIVPVAYDSQLGVNSIALDVPSGKMYWTVFSSIFSAIERANLDGTSLGPLISQDVHPKGIAIDSDAGKIYWADARKIMRADLNGSNIVELLSYQVNQLQIPVDVALDPLAQKIYWTDRRASGIHRANLDGSNIELVLPASYHADTIAVDYRVPGDCDSDGMLGSIDHQQFTECLGGPETDMMMGCGCQDANGDANIDLRDFASFQRRFSIT